MGVCTKPAGYHIGKNVSITYGQPSKKGRVLFGDEGSGSLEKYGKVWRLGANSATVITFKKDGSFAGKPVKAGTYTFFAIPTAKDWTIILNGQLGQWGAYDYEKHKSKDVLKVVVPAKPMLLLRKNSRLLLKITLSIFSGIKKDFRFR
jgi:hypothetical protein